MLKKLAGLTCAMVLAGQGARADVPQVAADIAPVHALVARVMQGAGAPDLIVRPGASPHGYAMRPSEAAALQRADLVIWMGEGLTPWLEGPVENLPGGARVIELLALEETRLLDWRQGATFAPHDHESHGMTGQGGAADHAGDDDHAHDDEGHDDHDHDDHAQDTHGQDDHAHDHSGADPHAWLDPDNAARWLPVIADALAERDPDNAELYRANAAAGQVELATLGVELTDRLIPARGKGFVVFHDAYHYFEARFGVEATGAVSLGDASDPGAARIRELRDRTQAQGIRCALSEPQFDTRILTSVLGGELRIGVIDPLGSAIEPGPALYPQMMRDMARAIADCVAP